MRWVEQVARMG